MSELQSLTGTINYDRVYPTIDASLSIEGAAADAKATGDALQDRAPAGYSEAHYSVSTDEELDAVLESVINTMAVRTRKIITISGATTDQSLGGGVHIVEINYLHSGYALVRSGTYQESGRQKVRVLYNGVWGDWGYELTSFNIGTYAAPAGHTHTAADIGAAPAGHTHTAADVGAAPAGYTEAYRELSTAEDFYSFLDANIPSIGCRKVIRISSSGTNPLGGGIYMLTIDHIYNNYVSVDIVGYIDGGRYRKVVKLNGVWNDIEWVNPPMLPGVEYRTVERWNSKPVYRKCVQYINETALSGDTLYSIPHNISNLDRSYGVEITARTAGYQIPYIASSETTAVTGCSASNIELRTTGSTKWSSGRTWYFDMKYVKSE